MDHKNQYGTISRSAVALFVVFNTVAQVFCLNPDLGDSPVSSVIPLGEQALIDSGDFRDGPFAPPSGKGGHRTTGIDRHSLESKLLQQELQKLPFSKNQLGEGMAMRKELSYQGFSSLADNLRAKQKRIEDQMQKLNKEKTDLERKELTSREEATALKQKLKTMVTSEKYEDAKRRVGKLKMQLKAQKSKKRDHPNKQLLKEEKAKLSSMETKLSQARQEEEEKVEQAQEHAAAEIAQVSKAVKEKYFVDMTKVTTWEKRVAAVNDELKDLRTQVKDSDKKEGDMKAALVQEEQQEIAAVKRDDARILKAEQAKERGLEQKIAWDKRTVLKAEDARKAEGKAMTAAMDQSKALEETEQQERTELKEVKHDAVTQQAQDKSKLNKLELGNVIEHEKEKVSAARIDNIRERANEKMKEEEEEAKAAITAAKDKYEKEEKDMKTKVQKLKEELRSQKEIEQSDVARTKAKVMLDAQERETKMENDLEKAQVEEEQTMREKLKDDDKLERLAGKLEDEKQQEKGILAKERAEATHFKEVMKLEEKRVQKRVGARQEAAMLKQETESKDSEIKQLVKRSKELQQTVTTDADKQSALEKKVEREEDKLGQDDYKLDLLKHKHRSLLLDYKKLRLKYKMLQQEAGHTEDDAGTEKSLAADAEHKYETELEVSQAAKKEVELLKARAKLAGTRVLRLEERADKYKQEKNEEIENTKHVADAVRARWSTKLITAEAQHAKDLMKLKHKMETNQLLMEKKLLRAKQQADQARRKAEKAKSKVHNLERAERYAVDMVGKQQVNSRVKDAYMAKMAQIRQRYNKEFQSEYAAEVRNLKNRIAQFENGQAYAQLKSKIVILESQLGKTKRQLHSTNAVEAQPSSMGQLPQQQPDPTDMTRLMSQALQKLEKDADKYTKQEYQKRVSAVVNAIVSRGMATEHAQAAKLVDKVLAGRQQPSVKVGTHLTAEAVRPNALMIHGS